MFALAAAVVLPTAVPSDASAARPDRFERAVIRKINEARRAHGLPPVRHRSRLARAADRHSRELVRTGRFSHVSLRGRTVGQRLRRVSRGAVGEVLAWVSGRRRASRTVSSWLASPGHRRVLLDGRFRRVGVGARYRHGSVLVTADFAQR